MNLLNIFIFLSCLLSLPLVAFQMPSQEELLLSLNESLPLWVDRAQLLAPQDCQEFTLLHNGYQVRCVSDGSKSRYILEDETGSPHSCLQLHRSRSNGKDVLDSAALDNTLVLKFSYDDQGRIRRAEKRTLKEINITTIRYEQDSLVLSSGTTETHYIFKNEPVDLLLCREKSEKGVKRIIVIRNPSEETTFIDNGSSLDSTNLTDVTKRNYKKCLKDSYGRILYEELGYYTLDPMKEVPQSCSTSTYTQKGSKSSERVQDFTRNLDVTINYDNFGRVTSYTSTTGKTTIFYDSVFDSEFQDVFSKTTTIKESGLQSIEWKDKNSFPVRIENRDAFGNLQQRRSNVYDLENNTITTTIASYHNNALSSCYTLQTKKNSLGCIEWTSLKSGNEERRTTYRYDNSGKLLSKRKPSGTTLYYEYENNLLSRVFSDDATVEYTIKYFDDGKIAEINDLTEKSALYRIYDTQGNLVEENYNGIHTAFTYVNNKKTGTLLPDGSSIEHALANDQEVILRKDVNGSIMYSLSPSQKEELESEGTIQFGADGQIEAEEGEFPHTFSFNANHELLSKDNFSCERNSFGDVTFDGVAHYTYDTGGNLTEKRSSQGFYQYYYDALDRITKITLNNELLYTFHYDLFGRMRKEIHHTVEGEKTKLLIWDENEEIGSLDNFGEINELKINFHKTSFPQPITAGCEFDGNLYRTTHDKRGSITSLVPASLVEAGAQSCGLRYLYSAFGEEKIIGGKNVNGTSDTHLLKNPWRYRGKRTHAGLVYFGLRHYMPENQRWMSQDPTSYCDGMNTTCYVHNDPIHNIDTHGLFSIPLGLPAVSFNLWEMLGDVFKKSVDTITFTEKSLDLFFDFRSHFEDIAFKMVQKRFLMLLGYSPDPTCSGVIGDTVINSKVRVTSINGILNAFDDAQINSRLISETHGNIPVHYVYSRTHGFTGDLLRALLVKTGFTSPQAEILAETWRGLIQEMGGPSGGGKIIHYAHSLGGADTKRALALITSEERDMIEVRTFGSAAILSKHEAPVVENYISSNDGIPLLVDSYNYFLAVNGKHDAAEIIPSHLDIPLIDHTLTGTTYRAILENLGKKFVNTYAHPAVFKQLSLQPKDIPGSEPSIENRPPPFEGAFGVHSPRTPEGIFRDLIKYKAFFNLGRVIERQMEKKLLKLYELEYLQESTGCLPLKYALDAAKAIQNLDSKPLLPIGSLIRLTLYIETNFISEKAKGNYLISREKTGLPRSIEYDPKTHYTFIHIGEDSSGYIGRGTHKVVVKSLLYDRVAPEILARCIMKQAGNEAEVALLKKFDGLKGLIEVRALILRGKVDGQRQYDIFLKYYNSGTLSKFVGSKEHKKMSLKERLVLAIDLVKGLGNMHREGYVHRDLHCNNYFLHKIKDPLTGTQALRLVVGDYGQARRIKDCRDMIAQPARFYRSPESIIHGKLRGNHYKRTDVYAMGCVFHSLFYYKRPPWFNDAKYPTGAGSKPTPQLIKIRKRLEGHITRRANTVLSPVRKKKKSGDPLTTKEKVDCLIFKMIHLDSRKRPSARAVEERLRELLKECQN